MVRGKDSLQNIPQWPYPIKYDVQNEVTADVLVLGGGISGCFAAINAARKGARVVIVEKGATERAGAAAAGVDHWLYATTNPASKVTPEEVTEALLKNNGGWICGVAQYIQCKESYDALLDLEKFGMKIRDTEDEFKGADFRDEETKLLFCWDYENKFNIRVWGTSAKPALYNECERLNVEIHDRTMVTSLLTEGGKPGARVIGATGVNVRTGEFTVFKAKATVLCMNNPTRLWQFSTEMTGLLGPIEPHFNCGDGQAMAWQAGAEFTMLEATRPGMYGGVIPHCTGNSAMNWFPCSIVDATGRALPWVDDNGELVPDEKRGYPVNVPGQKLFLMGIGAAGLGPVTAEFQPPRCMMIRGGTTSSGFIPPFYQGSISPESEAPPDAKIEGEVIPFDFLPPFYADLPSMSDHERRVLFGLHYGQEGYTSACYRQLLKAGFDSKKDMVQVSAMLRAPSGWRLSLGSGIVPDWDLRSNLEGLYAAGCALFSTSGVANAAATGRYAGRKAADYALGAGEPTIDTKQVEGEKRRVYAPVRRKDGMEWKELNAGVCKIMQDYCGDTKAEESLKVGLKWFSELREGEGSTACARNPHELMRVLECFNIMTCGEMVIHASLARRASSAWLGFERLDYPEKDPPEWDKWITAKLENNGVKIGEKPIDYWGTLEENYSAHCGL